MSEIADKATILDISDRVEKLPQGDRGVNSEIREVLGDQFYYPYTTDLNSAETLVPKGYYWGVGISLDEDTGSDYAWANVRSGYFPPRHFDCSVRAATPAIALTAAALRAIVSLPAAAGNGS